MSGFRPHVLAAALLALLAAGVLPGCASHPGRGSDLVISGPQVGNPVVGAFRIESRYGDQGWDHVLVVRKDDDVYPGFAPRRYDRAEIGGIDSEVLRMAEAETFCPETCSRHYEIIIRLDEAMIDFGRNTGGLIAHLSASGCACPPFSVRVGPDYLDRHVRRIGRYRRG
ncbi:hypothetical protein [Hyphobacterium marinum]|uniref:Lipoprotein n=1 Tax=Hyphobacterium marinum TaxID=3116574 RepID=A0ABU7LUM4_9PROT|nr:hypothetical protein [Hyphobacterium sp. Y6023]MEE2565266.1 hypothetical protein [Hyphobacterium sp. Y6023]